MSLALGRDERYFTIMIHIAKTESEGDYMGQGLQRAQMFAVPDEGFRTTQRRFNCANHRAARMLTADFI